MKKLLLGVFASALFCLSAPVSAQTHTYTVSVPFSDGFIGEQGTSTNQADDVRTFSTLGITGATFSQQSATNQFEKVGTQGNDIGGTLTLETTTGTFQIPGAFNWVKKVGGKVKVIGFIPQTSVSSQTLAGYSLNAGTNYAVILNGTTFSVSDGDDIQGSADNGILQVLNTYLDELRPSGPVAVTAQTTLDTTPTVTGSATIGSGDSLSVTINGVTYTTSNGLTVNTANDSWSVQIPAGSELTGGQTYDVTATITNSANLTLEDSTTSELTITAAAPALRVTMSVNESTLGDGAAASDRLEYTITVANTGNVPLYDLTWTQALENGAGDTYAPSMDTPTITGNGGSATDGSILAVGDILTFTLPYDITQADLDSGSLASLASIRALVTDGATGTAFTVESAAAGNTTTGAGNGAEITSQLAPTPAITLVMTATPNYSGAPQVGDTLTYAYTITNSGNVTLSGVTVSDPDVSLAGTAIASLAPGAQDTATFTATYPLTQADLDAGQVSNTATVTGQDPSNTDVTDQSGTAVDNDTATVTILPEQPVLVPNLTIAETMAHTDSDNSGDVTVGDTLVYTITVINSGETAVMGLAVTPSLIRADNSNVQITLSALDFSVGSSLSQMLVGGTATATVTHVITADDLAAGQLTASATAAAWEYSDETSAEPIPGTEDVTDTLGDPIVTPVTSHGNPSIALRKSGVHNDIDSTRGTSVGDTITYTFEVRNTGDVTLTNVTLTDPLLGGTQSTTIPALAAGETDSNTFVIDYDITQADIDRGYVSNLATIEGTAQDTTVDDLSGPTFDTDEEIITFLGSIAGTVSESNLGMRGLLVILLDQATGTEVARTFTDSEGNYVFLQLDEGTYAVQFARPTGQAVHSHSPTGSADGEVVSGLVISFGSDMSLTDVNAQLVDPSGVVYDAITRQPLAGATVTLLHNGTAVDDSWLDTASGDANNVVTGSDGAYSFLLQSPAQSGTYSIQVSLAGYSYVSQIIPPQAGSLTTAIGAGVTEIVPSDTAPASNGGDETYYTAFEFTFGDWTDNTTLSQGVVHNHIPMDPDGFGTALRVTKTADTSGLSTIAQVGDVITYTITVENTGDLDYSGATLDDPLTADEALTTETGVTDDGLLNAGEVWTYTASYTLTAADLNRGKVENMATVQATLIAGSTATTGATPTGTDIGGLYTFESSPSGNTTAGIGNGTATVTNLNPDLIEMIKEDLTAILEDDLRTTMQRQSELISGFGAEALDWLKTAIRRGNGDYVRLCAPDADPLSGHVEASNGSVDIDAEYRNEICNDLTGTRIIDTLEATVTNEDDLGQQHLLSYTHRRERLTDNDRVRGTFVGGYLSKTAVTDRAEGSISGMGLDAGLYGAGRVAEDTYYTYHLGGIVGRHSYDLDFDRAQTINATGDYSYFGLFAGASLAGDLQFSDTLVTPRVGIDLFYTPDTSTHVTATSDPFEQSATLSIDGARGSRIFVEGRFANDPLLFNDGEGLWDGLEGELAFTLRAFCDTFDGVDARCGTGGSVEYAHRNQDTGRITALRLDAEGSSGHTAVSAAISLKRPFADGRGQTSVELRASADQAPTVAAQAELKF